jgi:hypothetical protein
LNCPRYVEIVLNSKRLGKNQPKLKRRNTMKKSTTIVSAPAVIANTTSTIASKGAKAMKTKSVVAAVTAAPAVVKAAKVRAPKIDVAFDSKHFTFEAAPELTIAINTKKVRAAKPAVVVAPAVATTKTPRTKKEKVVVAFEGVKAAKGIEFKAERGLNKEVNRKRTAKVVAAPAAPVKPGKKVAALIAAAAAAPVAVKTARQLRREARIAAKLASVVTAAPVKPGKKAAKVVAAPTVAPLSARQIKLAARAERKAAKEVAALAAAKVAAKVAKRAEKKSTRKADAHA